VQRTKRPKEKIQVQRRHLFFFLLRSMHDVDEYYYFEDGVLTNATLSCTMLLRSLPCHHHSSNSLPLRRVAMVATSTTTQGGCESKLGCHFGSSGCYPSAIIECVIYEGPGLRHRYRICRIKCLCNYSFICPCNGHSDGYKMMHLFAFIAIQLCHEDGVF